MQIAQINAYLPLFSALCLLAVQPAAGQTAGAKYDGSYKGSAETSSGGVCVNFRPTMAVKDGEVSLPYGSNFVLKGSVSATGAVTAQATQIGTRAALRVINLTGQITNGMAMMVSESSTCHYELKLSKQP